MDVIIGSILAGFGGAGLALVASLVVFFVYFTAKELARTNRRKR